MNTGTRYSLVTQYSETQNLAAQHALLACGWSAPVVGRRRREVIFLR